MKWGSSTVAPPIEISSDIHSKQEKQLAKKKKQTAMAAITSSFNLFVLIIVIAGKRTLIIQIWYKNFVEKMSIYLVISLKRWSEQI